MDKWGRLSKNLTLWALIAHPTSPFASAVQYISLGHCDLLADIVEHAALVKCVLKKQIIDGSACRSGCKSPFVFCDSKSTEMKIEMTNKKEKRSKF